MTQKECAICLLEFSEKDVVTPLSCDIRHYLHTKCIEKWIQTKKICPLCRKPICAEDLHEFNSKLDTMLREQSSNSRSAPNLLIQVQEEEETDDL